MIGILVYRVALVYQSLLSVVLYLTLALFYPLGKAIEIAYKVWSKGFGFMVKRQVDFMQEIFRAGKYNHYR